MKKFILFAIALVVTAGSLFATDLQNAVTRAIVEVEQNDSCANPLGLTPTTFDGQNYLLVFSNHINNFYVPEYVQDNYVDQTILNIGIHQRVEYPNKDIDEIEYADERNPNDALYAFTRRYTSTTPADYYIVRVVREKKNRYVNYMFVFQQKHDQNEIDFRNIIREHHVQWINAMRRWTPPEFDKRKFSCEWLHFVQN